ncbi:MAG TPA: hypothetical protein EYG03_26840, partial [Planctomycetes bacterium]|nr:hypothetical protein [Planctomycetota bacterium]
MTFRNSEPDAPQSSQTGVSLQLDGNPPAPRRMRVKHLRRWMTHAVIVVYLSWLGHGVFCHALQYRVSAHPLMYFTVWDMFCGWSGWSYRTHVVAEGESGK